MKTTLLFLLLGSAFSAVAQNVFIPDANLKKALVGNPNVNTNNDTEIQVSEALQVKMLDLSYNTLKYKTFTDMTGLEAFENLTYLDITGSQDSTLDFSNNTKLSTLICNSIIGINISLQSINLSKNADLEHLEIFENGNGLRGKTLDLSHNPKLTILDATYTDLATICLSNLSIVTNKFLKDEVTKYSQGCFTTSLEKTSFTSTLCISPNPFQESTQLLLPPHEKYRMEITDMQGKLVMVEEEVTQTTLERKDLGKGMFFVSLTHLSTGKTSTVKLICEE